MSNEELMKELSDIKSILYAMVREKLSTGAPEMIGIEEAARVSKLSVGTLYQYASKGKLNIPITKIGRKLFFKKEDIIRWNVDRTMTTIRCS
jgi:hypothetical protein